jgi:hypothetical protein
MTKMNKYPLPGHMAQVQSCDDDCASAKERTAHSKRVVALLYVCLQPPSISQAFKCCGD